MPEILEVVAEKLAEANKPLPIAFEPKLASPTDTLERSVIGCMLAANWPDKSGIEAQKEIIGVWHSMTAGLKKPVATLFTMDRSRIVAQAILDMDAADMPVNELTVLNRLARESSAEKPMPFSASWLISCAELVFNPWNIGHFLNELFAEYQRRELVRIASELQGEAACTATEDLNDLMRKVSERLQTMQRGDGAHTDVETSRVSDITDAALTEDRGLGRVIRNCHSIMHSHTGGFKRGELSLIAANTGFGKTAECLQQAFFTAVELNGHVLVFLFESDDVQVQQRYAMQRFFVDGRRFNDRRWSPAEQAIWIAASADYANKCGNLHGYYRKAMNGAEISTAVQDFRTKTGIAPDLVVVDHINRLKQSRAEYGSDSHSSIHENIDRLWEMAARENCALLLAMQYTKDTQGKAINKKTRPTLSDLKGSGSVAESCKLVYFLHSTLPDMESSRQIVSRELVIEKANDGPQGVINGYYVKCHALTLEEHESKQERYQPLFKRFGALPPQDEELPE